jgi:hypothetical protein
MVFELVRKWMSVHRHHDTWSFAEPLCTDLHTGPYFLVTGTPSHVGQGSILSSCNVGYV